MDRLAKAGSIHEEFQEAIETAVESKILGLCARPLSLDAPAPTVAQMVDGLKRALAIALDDVEITVKQVVADFENSGCLRPEDARNRLERGLGRQAPRGLYQARQGLPEQHASDAATH